MKNKFTSIYDIARVLVSIADLEAKKSNCEDKKVGAVLFDIKTGEVVGQGHNDATTPCLTCIKKEFIWQYDKCFAIHAEVNAIFNYFQRHGYKDKLKDLVMICTTSPCDQCIKYMIKFGIQLILYDKNYKCDYGKWQGQIKVEKFYRKKNS